jgi:hypothetical protein
MMVPPASPLMDTALTRLRASLLFFNQPERPAITLG